MGVGVAIGVGLHLRLHLHPQTPIYTYLHPDTYSHYTQILGVYRFFINILFLNYYTLQIEVFLYRFLAILHPKNGCLLFKCILSVFYSSISLSKLIKFNTF